MNSTHLLSEFLYKILLIGNSGVGKSCLLMRYAENTFTDNFFNTIGVDFKIKTISLDGHLIRIQIWDTAGQERFRTLTTSYYRGAHGIIIIYDITDKDSFANVKLWMQEIEKFAKSTVIKLLVGNKCDMTSKRQVKYEEGLDLAKQHKIQFIEASAKNSSNVEEAFDAISKEIFHIHQHHPQSQGNILNGGTKLKEIEIEPGNS